jgi:hypothetical protein
LSKISGAALVAALFVIVVILDIALPTGEPSFGTPLLISILNTVFVGVIYLVVVYVSAKSYLIGGSPSLLLLGSGVLAFALAALLGGWLIGPVGPNVAFTLANISYLFSSIIQVSSGALALTGAAAQASQSRRPMMLYAYLGVLLFTAIVAAVAIQRLTPVFFIEGVGSTPIRLWVTGSTVVLFALASLLFMRVYSKSRAEILYWYSLGLALVAIGMLAFSLQESVIGPGGWAGRIALYLSGTYFLIAIVTARR